MDVQFEKLFRSSYSAPNAVQSTDDGVWLVDQITDRAALMDPNEVSDHHSVPKLLREVPSESSNTSGMAAGEGSLWLVANGGSNWRESRPADTKSGGTIFRVDPQTGETQSRNPVPGGGGSHGMEYDNIEPGNLWLTTLKDQTLTKVRIEDWSVQHVIPLPLKRGHGVVRVSDGVWVVHTADRVIVKLSVEDGSELDRIEVVQPNPTPHGLSAFGDDFIYCDAESGWVVKIVCN